MLIFLLLILLINLLNQFRQFHFLFLFFLFLFYFYLFIYIYRKFYVSLWDYTGLFECLFIFMHKWPYCFARMLKKKDIDQKQWTRSKSTYEARIGTYEVRMGNMASYLTSTMMLEAENSAKKKKKMLEAEKIGSRWACSSEFRTNYFIRIGPY